MLRAILNTYIVVRLCRQPTKHKMSRDTTVQLRTATEDDISAIVAIYSHYVDTSLATLAENINPRTLLHRHQAILSRGLPYLVAAHSATGDIAGFAYADLHSERSGYQYTVEDTVYLHPDHCGKGLGKQLLGALIEDLTAAGKRNVLAKMSMLPHQTYKDLATCRLHASFGFQPVGRLRKVGYKFGQWLDVALFQLSLGEPEAP